MDLNDRNIAWAERPNVVLKVTTRTTIKWWVERRPDITLASEYNDQLNDEDNN